MNKDLLEKVNESFFYISKVIKKNKQLKNQEIYSFFIKANEFQRLFPLNSIICLLSNKHEIFKKHPFKTNILDLDKNDNMFKKLSINDLNKIFNYNNEEMFLELLGKKDDLMIWKEVFRFFIQDLKNDKKMKYDMDGEFLVPSYRNYLAYEREKDLIEKINPLNDMKLKNVKRKI